MTCGSPRLTEKMSQDINNIYSFSKYLYTLTIHQELLGPLGTQQQNKVPVLVEYVYVRVESAWEGR